MRHSWRWLLAAVLAGGAPTLGVDIGGRHLVSAATAHTAYLVAFAAIVVAAWSGARRADTRLSWALIAGALTAWWVGDCFSTAFPNLGVVAGVGLPDVLWLGGYPLFAIAIIGLVRRRAPGATGEVWLDGIILTTAAAMATIQLVVLTTIDNSSLPEAVLSAAYPLGDVVLFAALALLVLSPGPRGVSTGMLVGALALTQVADLAFALWPDAVQLDAVLLLANGLIACAALHPHRDRVSQCDSRRRRNGNHPARTVFLGLALWTAPTLAIVGNPSVAWRIVFMAGSTVVAAGVLVRFTLVVREREQVRAQLQHDATHDRLTGLANRALLEDTVAAAGADAALLFIDHDGFKPINDRFGHSAGDRVLVEIARRCAAAVRPADLVARLGGDEFAVLARTGADAALTDLADRLLEAIRSPIDLDGQPVRVSATIGIAEATTARERAPSGSCELLAAADLAMYEAKRAGGDRWSAARAPSLTR